MTTSQPPTQQQRRRDRCTQRAVAAAVAVAREHGLRVEEPVVLNAMVSVVVHLRPAPVVARVPTWSRRLLESVDESLRREIAVTSFLARQGAPVVPPSPELPPGPHERDGVVIGFWTYVEPDPERTVTNADCIAMLPDLHDALRAYPDPLPGLDPGVIDIRRWLAMLNHSGHSLSDDDLLTVHAAVERLSPFLEAPPSEIRTLHGDAHDENLIATRDGLRWIDFECVCRGPVEWDLTMLRNDEAVAGYPHDPALLARCWEVKALQIVLGLSAMADVFGDIDQLSRAIQRMLGVLRAEQ